MQQKTHIHKAFSEVDCVAAQVQRTENERNMGTLRNNFNVFKQNSTFISNSAFSDNTKFN